MISRKKNVGAGGKIAMMIPPLLLMAGAVVLAGLHYAGVFKITPKSLMGIALGGIALFALMGALYIFNVINTKNNINDLQEKQDITAKALDTMIEKISEGNGIAKNFEVVKTAISNTEKVTALNEFKNMVSA